MLRDAARGGRMEEIIALLDAGVNIDVTDEVRLFINWTHIVILLPL